MAGYVYFWGVPFFSVKMMSRKKPPSTELFKKTTHQVVFDCMNHMSSQPETIYNIGIVILNVFGHLTCFARRCFKTLRQISERRA